MLTRGERLFSYPAGPPMDDASADKLLKWLAAQLKGNDQGLVQVSLKALMSILRQDAYRQKFYHETDGLEAYV
jgi:hypothetical protein